MPLDEGRKINILVVDDTPENLTVLRYILLEHGYVVRPALSGDVALSAIAVEAPDLILLDIMMPGMDGYEVCRKLKREEATSQIPIIFISALDETGDKVRAFRAGAVDYITKPFQPEEVLARVDTHITLSRLQRDLEEKNDLLQKALAEVKTLNGLLPICSFCKKIRDDKGYWNQIESYISKRSRAQFSHSVCEDCLKKHYPEVFED